VRSVILEGVCPIESIKSQEIIDPIAVLQGDVSGRRPDLKGAKCRAQSSRACKTSTRRRSWPSAAADAIGVKAKRAQS